MHDINWDAPEPVPATGDTIIVNVADVRLKASKNTKGWNTEIAVTNKATQYDCDEALMRLDFLKAQMEARFG